MEPLKLPEPDGFNVGFYQKHWATVGRDVSDAVLSLLNREGMHPSLNSTYIVLIPKKHDDISINDFRSISLCNVFYKLFSKTLTIRLKPIMNVSIYRE